MSTESSKLDWKEGLAWILLALSVGYLFLLLKNQNICWFHPEMTRIHLKALETGTQFTLSDLHSVFNFEAWEWAPRTTRPLASFFSIVDAKIRALLALVGILHPSLSLTWLLVLFMTPVCLLRFLWNEGVRSRLILVLTLVLYLLSTSTLCLVVMYFRPSKALASLMLVLNLLGAQHSEKLLKQGRLSPPLWIRFCIFQAISYLVDETAMLSFPFTWILFPSLIQGWRRKIFFSLPIVYLTSILLVIPGIAFLVGFPWAYLFQYRPAWSVTHFLSWQDLPNILQNLFTLFRETLNLYSFQEWRQAGVFSFLGLLAWGGAIFLLVEFLRRRKGWDSRTKSFFLMLFLLVFYHSMMMGSVTNRIWGNYWYGTYYVLPWVIFLGLWSSRKQALIPLLIFVSIWSVVQMYQFPYLNQVWYNSHYFPYEHGSLSLSQLYRSERSRFVSKPFSQPDRKILKNELLEWLRNPSMDQVKFPLDLYYIPITLQIAKLPSPWGYELGEKGFLEASLTRQGQVRGFH